MAAGGSRSPAPPPQSAVELKPETLQAIRDGLWMVVNGAGTGGTARIAGRDVSGKTGTAQVISLEGGRRPRARPRGPARPRLVRVLRAARQPADCRRGVRRARRARRRTRRRSRSTCSRRSSPRRTAGRCRRRCRCADSRSRRPTDRRTSRSPVRPTPTGDRITDAPN